MSEIIQPAHLWWMLWVSQSGVVDVVLCLLTQHGVQHKHRGSRMVRNRTLLLQYYSSVAHDRAPVFPYSFYIRYCCKVNMKPSACHEFNVNSIKACEVWIVFPQKSGGREKGYGKVLGDFLSRWRTSPALITSRSCISRSPYASA